VKEVFRDASLPKVLAFVKKVFPCARFILNYRSNVQAQVASQRENNFPLPISASELYRRNKELVAFHNSNRKTTFLLPLEEFSDSKFSALLAWIGIKNCSFSRIVHANTNYQDDSEVETKGECKFSK